MSATEAPTASPRTSSAPQSTDEKVDASSPSPENPTSLASILAELQLEQVLKTLWRGSSHQPVKFQLTPTHCVAEALEPKQQTLSLPWSDVLGAHVLTADGEHVQTPVDVDVDADAKFLLGVFACVCKSHKPKTLKKRRLSEFFFRFSGQQMPLVLKLQEVVNFVADPRNQAAVEKLQSLDAVEVVSRPKRKFLVMVNPVSGQGRAVQIYENKVAPVFRFANVETEVKILDHANHAMEIAMEIPLGVYDCVVAVGGDGSLYETVQGLMKRPDWNLAIRQPIGIIPGGSGNGLAHSIAHQSEEKGKPVNAAFILAKGMPHDLDITSVRNGKETTYSFLSLEWASIADVDIGSEKLRMLGGLRFTVAFVNQLVFQRPEYPGTIWYLEEGETEEPPHYFKTHDPNSTERPKMDLFDSEGQGPPETSEPEDKTDGEAVDKTEKQVASGGKWKELGGHFRIVWVMNVSHAASDALLAPGAEFDDGYNYITFMDGAHPRKDLLAMMLAIETGDHMDKKGVQQVRTRAFKLVPERSTDLMCVDGEVVEGPYLEAQRGCSQVPVPDERMQHMITKLKLTAKDLRVLYGRFSRYDKELRHLPAIETGASEFYTSIDEKHSEFGDAIFALIDEDNSGVLDFSEYVEALGKFCLLNKEDMLKFCFNVFDDDKNGTIEGEELTHLLEILHADEQTSNMKHALKTFDFNGDGKIDFVEFKQLNTQFPSLLYPAFRIQQNMKIFTLGEKWWERKIEELVTEHHEKLAQQAAENVEDLSDEALRAKKAEMERVAKLKRQEQAIRIRMGCMYYTCCPCRRRLYIIDDEQPEDSDNDSDDERMRRKKVAATKKSKKDGKKKNIVPIGPRKPLSQEERLERARKRRLRDMQDRPTRKD
uniref:Uncharacterized protein n=1 Tax=Phytophthora fragariae TaxID=53985 RepID=A0A6A3E1Z7_9STRA|nr:hypothetical protein PF009_g21954 [Phytophthora fragariae]